MDWFEIWVGWLGGFTRRLGAGTGVREICVYFMIFRSKLEISASFPRQLQIFFKP